MTGRTSSGVKVPGPHAPQPGLGQEDPPDDLREPESVRADEALWLGGEERELLRQHRQSAREHAMQRLDSPPPEVTS